MWLNNQGFEQYQREEYVVAEGVRRAMILVYTCARSRFTTDDRTAWVDSFSAIDDEFPGCV